MFPIIIIKYCKKESKNEKVEIIFFTIVKCIKFISN
jgi:hypothetical protein